jgi:hypothetical protein
MNKSGLLDSIDVVTEYGGLILVSSKDYFKIIFSYAFLEIAIAFFLTWLGIRIRARTISTNSIQSLNLRCLYD